MGFGGAGALADVATDPLGMWAVASNSETRSWRSRGRGHRRHSAGCYGCAGQQVAAVGQAAVRTDRGQQ